MATQWGAIYAEVADVILESTPLSLGLLTDAQFYAMAAEVLLDFTGKSGLIKRLFNHQLSFGVQQYPQSPMLADLEGCLALQSFIYESSDFYLSNADREWQNFLNVSNPESYRQDSIPTKLVQVTPAPQVNGNQFGVVGGSQFGVIGGVQSFTDFTWTADPLTPVGFGTPYAFNGNPYVEALNPGWGVIATLVPSTNNLTMQGTALPWQVSGLTANSYIELVPDTFTPYLKYGILSRIFGGDSELRDEQKAAYCTSRYSEGIAIVAAVMCDVYQEQ